MADQGEHRESPIIVFTTYEPYLVVGLRNFKNHEGMDLDVEPVMALCRCGGSKRKPYCDGSHHGLRFSGRKSPDRVTDRVVEYRGREISILDNRGVCAHDKACVRNLPSVFNDMKRIWIDLNGANAEEIIEAVKKCPSGALSYKIGEVRYQDVERTSLIRVEKDGPLKVEGYIELKDDRGCRPESREHYTLCRCGKSKNKPFCDGTHVTVQFKDPLG
jgi:CDGSH-type Zn-finger protein/ferredoxin